MQPRHIDPIMAEVRAVRDEHAARFGYDVKAIFETFDPCRKRPVGCSSDIRRVHSSPRPKILGDEVDGPRDCVATYLPMATIRCQSTRQSDPQPVAQAREAAPRSSRRHSLR